MSLLAEEQREKQREGGVAFRILGTRLLGRSRD
jgi:hypothetical protein